MPEPRPHYRAERILDAATPVTAHEGSYEALGHCRCCQKPITVVSDEEPGKLARGLLAGLFTARRGGLTCDECVKLEDEQ
jgi:hypothetical protein